ncbi:MAG: hypothetical protein LBN38_00935 [Verrucomicrobiota bacterium]|jgi:hypothetical protein|nr:hypothetical protein [Verrucomicrobiota bacterium]
MLRHGVQLVLAVTVLGAAVAAGWWFGGRRQPKGSLMEAPASASARLEEGIPVEAPEPLIEAETAVYAVLSASDDVENNDIRTNGHAAAAVGGAADGLNDELLDLVTRESQLVMTRLVEEISGLQQNLEEQTRRNRRLSENLAEAQAALDVMEARRAQAAGTEPKPMADAPIEAHIVDANMELGLVVLDRGAQQGVRYGLPLTVMRDQRRVARIRVVDVREKIAGAVVEETVRGEAPQMGDRAVLIRPEGP